jgi:hypothetical protein
VSAPLDTLRDAGPEDLHRSCAICQTAFQAGERLGGCPGCGAPFHEECWEENGGCAVYGCARVPDAAAAPSAAPSVWGREERDCPACGGRIKVAARRCVHCGSAVAAEVGGEARSTPPGRGPAVALLLAGIVPFTAPFALVLGGLWLLANRRTLRRWPSSSRVLAVVGLAAAAGVTLVALAGLAVHWAAGGEG